MAKHTRQRINPAETEDLFRRGTALAQAGRGVEANQNFEKAARSGHEQACMAFATALAYGRDIKADPGRARKILKKGTKAGHPSCRQALASTHIQGFGGKEDWSSAIQLLTEGARANEANALLELGLLFCLKKNPVQSMDFLYRASCLNDISAQAILLRSMALHNRKTPDENQWLSNCRALNYPLTDILQSKLLERKAPVTLPTPDAPLDWTAITADLRSPPDYSQTTPDELCSNPRILTFQQIIPHELCDYLILHAAPRLKPAEVVDPTTGISRLDPYRQANTMGFPPLTKDPALAALDQVIMALAGLPHDQGEVTSVLHYTPGGRYKPHFDSFINEGVPDPELAYGGQRIRTALLVLNDDFKGGGTSFPRLDLNIRAKKGSVVVFDNVDESGKANPLSLHAGSEVTSGTKWLMTKWIRAERYTGLK